MDAAGVLPSFRGVLVHGAWMPCDTCPEVTHAYLSTAARHGIGMLDVLTRAASGTAWVLATG